MSQTQPYFRLILMYASIIQMTLFKLLYSILDYVIEELREAKHRAPSNEKLFNNFKSMGDLDLCTTNQRLHLPLGAMCLTDTFSMRMIFSL